MDSKCIDDHNGSQEKNRIHGAVFEIDIFFDAIDIANGELADDDGAEAVADEDEWDGECECECSEYAVDGERGIDYLQVENFTDV